MEVLDMFSQAPINTNGHYAGALALPSPYSVFVTLTIGKCCVHWVPIVFARGRKLSSTELAPI